MKSDKKMVEASGTVKMELKNLPDGTPALVLQAKTPEGKDILGRFESDLDVIRFIGVHNKCAHIGIHDLCHIKEDKAGKIEMLAIPLLIGNIKKKTVKK